MAGVKQDNGELLREYIGILWRQKLWVLFPLIGCVFLSIFLILYLPKVYRSTTLILVEAQKVPEEYVRSAVSGSVEGRLSTIQQQILSRSLLQRIIDQFGLYKEESKKMASEDVIDLMRKNIEVKTVGTRGVESFSLSFQGKDPVMVMKVTNELASLFIEENLKIREQLVEGASEFLDNELNSLKVTLEQQERKIGEFKRTHMGELPQQLEPNLRSLDRFQVDLQATQYARKSAEDRKSVLEKTLDMMRHRMEGGEGDGSEQLSPLPSAPEASLSPLMQRWLQQKRTLANLQREYKDNYPDIVMLKREIQSLEDQMAQTERPAPLREEKTKGRPDKRLEMEPVYILDLKKQTQTVETELKGLRERETMLKDQIKIYEARVESAPAREQELAILMRDYENIKKNYESLLDKKLNAKISENLEKRQKGEQFRILDPANLPEKPFKPDPIKIGLVGLVLGLGGGLGLAFMRDQLDGSLRKAEEVERITSVPVLASIPDFTEKRRAFDRSANKESVHHGKSTEKTNGV